MSAAKNLVGWPLPSLQNFVIGERSPLSLRHLLPAAFSALSQMTVEHRVLSGNGIRYSANSYVQSRAYTSKGDFNMP